MGKKWKSFGLVWVALIFLIAVMAAPVYAGKTLKVYTSADVNEMESWVAEAEKAIGMQIDWSPRMSSNELRSRVQAEAPYFQADMIWAFLNSDAQVGKERGWFIPYMSPAWADIPAEYKDPEGHWYGYNYWFAGGLYNTKLIKEKNLPIPKSWRDFGNPVYKGELVMPNPGTSGTAFLSVAAVMQLFGEEEGWKILGDMHKNVAQYTKSGSAPSQLVAQGEYAIGISWDQAIFGRVEKGFPIKGFVPTEGTSFDLESVAILKGCKNLEGAKKLVDWLGSKEGQTEIGKWRSKVTRPGIPGRVSLNPALMKYDALWSGENKKRIMSEWKKRFQR